SLLKKARVSTNIIGGRGGFHSHNTTARHRWNGRNLRILQCQTPLHSLCRRLWKLPAPYTIRTLPGS
ncbi:MAG: hypothetical protein NTZ51_08415, partial [Proteobacteria bacterium]|nr:hypothetical protein [Pseudomonadota bacterium]